MRNAPAWITTTDAIASHRGTMSSNVTMMKTAVDMIDVGLIVSVLCPFLCGCL